MLPGIVYCFSKKVANAFFRGDTTTPGNMKNLGHGDARCQVSAPTTFTALSSRSSFLLIHS
jgi:hypothetical protein